VFWENRITTSLKGWAGNFQKERGHRGVKGKKPSDKAARRPRLRGVPTRAWAQGGSNYEGGGKRRRMEGTDAVEKGELGKERP